MKPWKKPAKKWLSFIRGKQPPTVEPVKLQSVFLRRDVQLDIYLPPGYDDSGKTAYPFVIFNDGQDLPRMQFVQILEELFSDADFPRIIAVGVYASDGRVQEYGTARQADYKGRGARAGAYSRFMIGELLPYLNRNYALSELPEHGALAGFSLGALSALDIAWANQGLFRNVGVFSGALWWRWSAVRPEDPDADRIMHDIIRNTPAPDTAQRFWFECGTLDEEDDRNGNGVIDSIDDTLDLIAELRQKGFPDHAIRYVEIKDGRHDPETWGMAMDDFLYWTFTGPK